MEYIIISILLVSYLLTCIKTIKRLNSSIVLSGKQKKIHIILTLIIPFLWTIVILAFIKKTPGSHQFNHKNESTSNNFYESEKGFY